MLKDDGTGRLLMQQTASRTNIEFIDIDKTN